MVLFPALALVMALRAGTFFLEPPAAVPRLVMVPGHFILQLMIVSCSAM